MVMIIMINLNPSFKIKNYPELKSSFSNTIEQLMLKIKKAHGNHKYKIVKTKIENNNLVAYIYIVINVKENIMTDMNELYKECTLEEAQKAYDEAKPDSNFDPENVLKKIRIKNFVIF